MPILLNKISTKGGRGGVKKVQNLVYVEYGCRLSIFNTFGSKCCLKVRIAIFKKNVNNFNILNKLSELYCIRPNLNASGPEYA